MPEDQNVTIRPFQKRDLEALLRIIRSNTPQYFAPEEEADYIRYMQNEREVYFVAEAGTDVIGGGGVNFKADTDAARISWDMIHPDWHGRGAGSVLIRHRIRYITENSDVNRIIVRTSQLAYKFYQKQGFTLVKKEPDFWAEGYHLYFMEMSLEGESG